MINRVDKRKQTANKVYVSLSTSKKSCTLKVSKELIDNETNDTMRYDTIIAGSFARHISILDV